MKKLVVSLAAVATLSSSAFAGSNSQTGCGLGSMLFSADSTVMLTLQATTNGIFGNQTFGITSGTLGCKKPSSFVSNDRAQEFVASNMDVLAQEIAMGQGESIDTLAELLKVDDKAAFATALQAKFNAIYSSDKVEMADVMNAIATI
jgi:hypothetical protein